MNSTIIATHTAADIDGLFSGLQLLLPVNLPAGSHITGQIVVTLPNKSEKPGATQTVVPPSTESQAPAPSQPSAPSPAPVSDEPAKKRGRPKKEAPVEVVVEAAPVADPQIALPLAAPPAAPAKNATKDDVRSALHTLVTKHNLELGAAALSRFGARKLSDLKEDQYAAFIAACNKTTETGEA